MFKTVDNRTRKENGKILRMEIIYLWTKLSEFNFITNEEYVEINGGNEGDSN